MSRSRDSLHSTMYLLNHGHHIFSNCGNSPLHSTMYLLNLSPDARQQVPELLFTFHNVSIKSRKRQNQKRLRRALHSTMYLLNLCALSTNTIALLNFTFHNVSIKSRFAASRQLASFFPLHSTMYLLNLRFALACTRRSLLYIPQCIY